MKTNEFSALKEMIQISNRAILSKTDAEMFIINHSIKDLTMEMKKHNGRLLKLENCQQDNEKTINVLKWMRKKWIYVLLVGLITFYVLLTFYEAGLFINLIKFIGGKI
jgi:chromosome segregation ATPase